MTRRPLACALISMLVLTFAVPWFFPSALANSQAVTALYFPNWNVYSSSTGQVKDLPWDQVDCIYHAFWKVVPENGGYSIQSTDPWADTDPDNAKAHFPQYAQYAARYSQVDVMLSIGGWTCCGYFSEMASTASGRASFIESCLKTLDEYSFFDGLDIDWEYPGVARTGGSGDEGNPVKGDDKANYTLLLSELRSALNDHFGKGKKKLTVCAAASVDILSRQDYAALFPYVDRINLMTYDMVSSSSSKTGHHAALYGSVSADTAVKYLQRQGVPASKIAIGAPLYSKGWKVKDVNGPLIGAAAEKAAHPEQKWNKLRALEEKAVPQGTPGWHMGYDEKAQAAYLWNDDPSSSDYRMLYSYESAQSLAAKLQYIYVHSLGGIIVWESGGDDAAAGWPMTRQMKEALSK